jgi:hypothetical protein
MRNMLPVALLFASALTSGCLVDLPEPPAYPSVVDSPSNVMLGKDYCGRVFRAAEKRRRGFNAAMTAWFTVGGLAVTGFVPSTVYLAQEADNHDADVEEITMPILFGATAATAVALAITQIGNADESLDMRNRAADGALEHTDWDAFVACVQAVKGGDVHIDATRPKINESPSQPPPQPATPPNAPSEAAPVIPAPALPRTLAPPSPPAPPKPRGGDGLPNDL